MDTFLIVILIVAIYFIGSFVVVTISTIWQIYKKRDR